MKNDIGELNIKLKRNGSENNELQPIQTKSQEQEDSSEEDEVVFKVSTEKVMASKPKGEKSNATVDSKKSRKTHTIICKICNKKFERKDNYTQHVATVHEGKRQFQCFLCGKKFKQKAHLRRHTASIHYEKKSSM